MTSLTNEYDPPLLKDQSANDQCSEIQSIGLLPPIPQPAINNNDNNNNNNNIIHEPSSEITDIVAMNLYNSEPTIYDAWNTFIKKCCCCCKCKFCYYNNNQFHIDAELTQESTWQFEDEVEKALNEQKELKTQHKRIKSIKNKNNITFPYHNKIFSLDCNDNTSNVRELQTALIENDLYRESPVSNTNSKSKSQSRRHKREARMRCYCIPCLKYKPKIWQLISISIVIQLLSILIMGTIETIKDNNKQEKFRLFAQILLSIMWVTQFIVMIQLILICMKRLWDLTFFQIVQLYLTSILIFTGVYSTAYFYDSDREHGTFNAFNLNETEFANANFIERIFAFLYLSCSQQTLCGVCEIIPKSPPTMILAGIQMLFGIFFSIIIISIGISRLGEDIEKRKVDIYKENLKKQNRLADKSFQSMRSNFDNLISKTCWHLLTHNEKIIKFRRTTRRFLLVIVIIIQITKNLLEFITTDSSFADKHNTMHALIFIVFDLLNILVVLMTSLKFLHVGHMTELRLSFLLQTYLSTMLVFAGIYVDFQATSHHGKRYGNGAFITGEDTYIGMWSKFIYFSFAMMTLCGAGLDIKPKKWYAAFAVCNEMLLGLFFHVYIFGTGLLLLANNKYANNYSQNEKKRRNTVVSILDADGNETEMNIGSELIMSTLLNN
eukprot:218824_1